MYSIIITGPAKQDIQAAFDWWKDHRSKIQAERWYLSILAAIQSLQTSPERCAQAAESHLLSQGIRQLLFGLSGRKTHRIVFTIDAGIIIILRVRHSSQDVLTSTDI